jgi:hypothetical protein
MHFATLRRTEDQFGAVYFETSGLDFTSDAKDLDFCVVLACGETAVNIARGAPGRVPFDWDRRGSDGCDTSKARWFTSDAPNPERARRLVELKANSLLRVRWRAVQAVADHLEERRWIWPDDVDRLCRAPGARRAGEPRLPPTRSSRLPGWEEKSP